MVDVACLTRSLLFPVMLAFIVHFVLSIGMVRLLIIDIMFMRVTMLHVMRCVHKLRVVNFLIVFRHV